MSNTKKILSEREKTHGNFSDVAAMGQQLKAVMSMSKNWLALNHAQREALEYIQMKAARILSGDRNYRDHWEDIAGYAILGADCSNTSLATVEKDLVEAVKDAVAVAAEEEGRETPVLSIFGKKS
jgi:hypothetical protein